MIGHDMPLREPHQRLLDEIAAGGRWTWTYRGGCWRMVSADGHLHPSLNESAPEVCQLVEEGFVAPPSVEGAPVTAVGDKEQAR